LKNGYYYTASLGGKRIRVAAKYMLILAAALGFVAGAVVGALVNQQVIPNTGRIVIITPPPPELELQFFEDENCSIILTEINWCSKDPGEKKAFPAYVKNVGDVPFSMNLTTQNWYPVDAEAYLNATWDYNGTAVEVKEVRLRTFTLCLAPNVENAEPEIENFSFDIVIAATQA